MKMQVKSIDRVNRSGTSKTGNPYTIDQTTVTVEISYDNHDGFGFKSMTYQYGDSQNFEKLTALRGRLPMELEIELGTELNQYGSPVTVVNSISVPKQTA